MSSMPDTSIQAYDQVTPEALRDIYEKILGALKEIGRGNYETIAFHLNLSDRNVVSRRLCEMRDDFTPPLVLMTGTKSLTSRKRQARDYAIFSIDTVVPPLEKIMKGQMSTADYASKLIAATAKGMKIQSRLFKEDQ